MGVKIVVDSASDISEKEAKELGIVMVPMTITFGDENYLDGVNLLPNQFFEKLIESDVMPKTSQVNAFQFEEQFEKLTKNGDDVVVVTLSSKLSGTYQSAVQASSKYEGKVYVVDSCTGTIAERLLCEYALRLVDEGKSAKEIAQALDEKKTKVNLLAMLNTLEYLKSGGRISSTATVAGKVLTLKPVISIKDGAVQLAGKALGSKNGSNLLNKLVKEKGGIDFSMPYGVLWSGLDDSTLKKYVADSANLWQDATDNVPAYSIGGTVGTYLGPGAIGVAFFEK